MNYLSQLFLATFLLCFGCTRSLSCERHAHCAQSLSPSFCHNSECISYTSRLKIDGANRTSIKQIIREVNRRNISVEGRITIINTVATIFEQFNPNIFIYRNVVGIDPVKILYNFRNSPELITMSNFDFHLRMMKIFMSLDDFHSLYIPPNAISRSFALLGFTVQFFYTSKTSKPVFLVTDVIPGVSFKNPLFSVGAKILEYDGKDILQAARDLGEAEYSANDASTLTEGTSALTARFLIKHEIPFKKLVKVKFIPTNSTKILTAFIPWKIYRTRNSTNVMKFLRDNVWFVGSPFVQPLMLRTFSDEIKIHTTSLRSNRKPIKIKGDFENVISAEIIKTSRGSIGRFRLLYFPNDRNGTLVEEISRVFKLLPKNGLVIDMRKNQGGDPMLVKSITQLISSKTVPSSPLMIRATSLTERLINAENATGLGIIFQKSFKPALRGALIAKEPFSGPVVGGFEIFANDPTLFYKQVYFGPVITLVDASCYSACDLFTSFQRDVGTSFVVNLDKTTGGGGAGTAGYSGLTQLFPSVFKSNLPEGVDFLTSAIRFHRTGNQSGAIVEKVGVEPDLQYHRTKNDILNDDEDLFNFLASKLNRQST